VVGADLDRLRAPAVVVQREAQLVERVVEEFLVGHQHHSRFGDVADAADRLLGHGVEHLDDVGGPATLGTAVLGHAWLRSAPAACGLPAKVRKAPTMDCQARSMALPWPTSTTRTLPRCSSRAS